MRCEVVDNDGAASIEGGVVVVIDVMRAYTVAAWAFERGATDIVLMDDTDRAVEIAAAFPGALLFKDGMPDHRFDLHNSPHQLLDLDVESRRIVQRTTAGTRAAVAASGADVLLCASFVCATATAAVLRRLAPATATLVVSGGLGADEDLACAEFIAAITQDLTVDPAPFLERARRSAAAADLERGVALGYQGVTHQDVTMCLDVDRFDFAMSAEIERGTEELLVLRQYRP